MSGGTGLIRATTHPFSLFEEPVDTVEILIFC